MCLFVAFWRERPRLIDHYTQERIKNDFIRIYSMNEERNNFVSQYVFPDFNVSRSSADEIDRRISCLRVLNFAKFPLLVGLKSSRTNSIFFSLKIIEEKKLRNFCEDLKFCSGKFLS